MAEPTDAAVAEMAADSELVRLNPREVMARIHQRTAEMARIELRIQEVEAELKDLVDDRNRLARDDLPKLFDHLHTDRLGVPGQKADVVLDSLLHASIAKEWDEGK